MADLRGRKFRIAGLGGAVMQKMGVNVVLTPPGEIFAALQSGAVDAAEWVGPWNDLAFGLHQIAKYYYLPAFHEGGPALEISVNKQKYDALPKDLQQIVAAAAQATATTTLADFNWHNSISLEPLVRDHGVQPRTWPDDVVAEMGRATKEVLAEIAASSELAGKVHASFTNALGEVAGLEQVERSGVSAPSANRLSALDPKLSVKRAARLVRGPKEMHVLDNPSRFTP